MRQSRALRPDLSRFIRGTIAELLFEAVGQIAGMFVIKAGRHFFDPQTGF